ncbi:MAG: ROK family glucokinase [Bacilli bacterium]
MEKQWLFGVDLGGTTIKMALFTAVGELVEKWEVPTNKDENGAHIPAQIAEEVAKKSSEKGIAKDSIGGIGIGVPGPVDAATGEVIIAVNLGWRNFNVKQTLEQLTELPVSIDNDANVAALGEAWRGAGAGEDNVVVITLGTGVGGGVIANGQIVRGTVGAAGEIGHISTNPREGESCGCGSKGCLELYASATGIARLAKRYAEKEEFNGTALKQFIETTGDVTAKDVFEHLAKEDALAKAVVEEVAFHLGLAISQVGGILNPTRVVVGGGVSRAGEALLAPVREVYNQYTFQAIKNSLSIHAATLGNDAGIYGAASLVKKG